ncbi:reverse transcriptase domain-containing protein [Tanacetum coccineum]
MEEAAKRHAEQDEWLRKFYQNVKTNRENHDKIIQGLETKEIEYFSANSGFFYNEKQETDESRIEEALATLEVTPKIKQVPQEDKQSVAYHVEPYEPPIPFPRRLEHHAEEALVYKTMESLEKIKINRPLFKEIRQTDNYTKHIKVLVANKPKTEEDEEIRMNPRLDFNNALADLGASISIMPFFMYKRLGLGRLEPINMVIEMADNMKCTLKGIVKNLLIKIDKFIFLVDFVILEMVEDLRIPIILGRPLIATVQAKMKIRYGKVCKMTRERILKDHLRERFGDEEDDIEKNLEDPEEYREDKANTIIEAIHDKFNDDWFKDTSEDEDDLEGIIDYLEPKS